jgi:hypothetical protein
VLVSSVCRSEATCTSDRRDERVSDCIKAEGSQFQSCWFTASCLAFVLPPPRTPPLMTSDSRTTRSPPRQRSVALCTLRHSDSGCP